MNKKSLVKLLFVIVGITLIFSFIASQDVYHLDLCHEEHCHKCSVIHFAQRIVKLCALALFSIYIFISLGIVSYIANYCINKVLQESLVFQKVQFNE